MSTGDSTIDCTCSENSVNVNRAVVSAESVAVKRVVNAAGDGIVDRMGSTGSDSVDRVVVPMRVLNSTDGRTVDAAVRSKVRNKIDCVAVSAEVATVDRVVDSIPADCDGAVDRMVGAIVIDMVNRVVSSTGAAILDCVLIAAGTAVDCVVFRAGKVVACEVGSAAGGTAVDTGTQLRPVSLNTYPLLHLNPSLIHWAFTGQTVHRCVSPAPARYNPGGQSLPARTGTQPVNATLAV